MTTAVCTHWFVCEPANGATSEGVCKFCGLSRTFINSDPADWTISLRDRRADHKKRGGAVSSAQRRKFLEVL